MRRTKKQTVFSIIVIFSLAACAPAQAVPQDATQVQQFIQDSVAGTVAAEKSQEAPQGGVAAATPTPFPDTAVPTASLAPTLGFVTVTPAATTSSSGFVTITPQPTDTPVEETTEVPVGYDIYCEGIVNPSQTPQLPTQIATGITVTVENKVNLRTQPSRLKRIILVLKPGTQVKIVGGPVTTNYGGVYKYIWWQLELPGGLRGWAAEMSVCGRFYFMGPAS